MRYESSSDWVQAAEMWKACVNETLRQMEECRVQCEVAPQVLPEDRGVGTVDGVFQKAAGKPELHSFSLFLQNLLNTTVSLHHLALSLSLLVCRQYCATQVAMKPGRISANEDFLPSQLEHLHIAQFKGQRVKLII